MIHDSRHRRCEAVGVSDEPDDGVDVPEESPPTHALERLGSTPRRGGWLGDLDAYASIQRHLAAVDFTALRAAQRTIERATAFQIPSIIAAQDAVAKSFARSIDFTRLATAHRSLTETSVLQVAAAAQRQWTDSLSSAVDFSALRDAVASSAALSAFSAVNSALTEALQHQTDVLSRVFESINFELPTIDLTQWIDALDRWIPGNLHGVGDLDVVATLALDEGIPLRARAGRSVGWAPAVGPFDEFDGDHEGDGECDLVEPVVDEAVSVAA